MESRSLERLFFLLAAGSMAAVRRDSSEALTRTVFGSYSLLLKSAARPPHSKLGGDLGAYCDGLGAGWLGQRASLVVFVFQGGAYEGGE